MGLSGHHSAHFSVKQWSILVRRRLRINRSASSIPQLERGGMSILKGRLGRFLVAVVAIVVCILGTSMVVQVATIDGHRALVNRLAYRWSTPHRGDAVALYYPVKPDRVFDSLVLAEQGDTVRIGDRRVFVNGVPTSDSTVAADALAPSSWGPKVIPQGYCFVMDERSTAGT
jgi:signal peptidase I